MNFEKQKSHTNTTHKKLNNIKEKNHFKNFISSYYFILSFSIIIPLIIFFLIIYIYYRIKKRMKLKKQKENYNINKIHTAKPQKKESYNRIMNTSGIINNINQNEDNLTEIKIKNMKEEMKSINNNSGSSSGRRKREKRKIGKGKHNNVNEFNIKEEQKEMQNEIKEQIKQFVIEEHNNTNEE